MSKAECYYATYCRLDDHSGDSYITADANRMHIGYELEFTQQLHVTDRGKEVPRIILGTDDNACGFLPSSVYKHVAKLIEEGWTCRAFTSIVAYDKLEERNWSEVALICYAPAVKETFDAFTQRIAKRICKGEHPAVALSEKELNHVLETNGTWADTKTVELPKLDKGTAYYKTKQTATESLAAAAASGKKGCYIGLIAVAVVIIALVCLLVFR